MLTTQSLGNTLIPQPIHHSARYAMSKMRRRKYGDCVNICSDLLAKNPRDQVKGSSTMDKHLISTFIAEGHSKSGGHNVLFFE